MKRTFSHPWMKRLITVDEDGIREERRGRAHESIRWDEMIFLRRNEVQGERKRRIRVVLMEDAGKEFKQYASEVWKQRCPERWRLSQELAWRISDRAAYFWFPLLTLSPSIAFYVFLWAWNPPAPVRKLLQPEIQNMHRISIMTVLTVVAFEVFYVLSRKKERTKQE